MTRSHHYGITATGKERGSPCPFEPTEHAWRGGGKLIKAIVCGEDASFFPRLHLYASVLDMLGYDDTDDLDLAVYHTSEFITRINRQDDSLDIPLELRAYRYDGDVVHFVGYSESWVDTRCYPFEFESGVLTLSQWCRAKGMRAPEIISLKAARFACADDALLAYMMKNIESPNSLPRENELL